METRKKAVVDGLLLLFLILKKILRIVKALQKMDI